MINANCQSSGFNYKALEFQNLEPIWHHEISDSTIIGHQDQLGVTTSTATVQDKGFKIYPNPTTDDVFIEIQDSDVEGTQIDVYDFLGRKIHQQSAYQGLNKIDMNNLAKGQYILHHTSNNSTNTSIILKH